jgi:hypothetical protein
LPILQCLGDFLGAVLFAVFVKGNNQISIGTGFYEQLTFQLLDLFNILNSRLTNYGDYQT